MKPARTKYLVVLFVILFCSVSTAQDTIIIKLVVNPKTIDRTDLNASCRFEATHSNPKFSTISNDGDLEDFHIVAKVGDIIEWVGESEQGNCDIIDVKKIKRENKTEIFNSKSQKGKRVAATRNKVVSRKILSDTEKKVDYKYTLKFKVNEILRAYKIDPKIKVGSAKGMIEFWN